MCQNMVKLGQMVVNVVENGLIGVDVGSRGRTWLTKGMWELIQQNIKKSLVEAKTRISAMQEEIRSLEATVYSAENIFGNCSSLLLLKPMFANLKFSTLRIQVGDYLKSYGKFCFSVLCTRFSCS